MSCGPRLSSFLLDVSAEANTIDASEANKFLPLLHTQTLQLCGYPVHDVSMAMLQNFPPHIILNEYGVKVG